MLLLGVVSGQVDVIDVDVDLHHLQACHPLDGLLDIALDAFAELGDLDAVFHDDVEVVRGLGFAELDSLALGDVRAS